MAKVNKAIAALIKSKSGIQLDIGSGPNPEVGFLGMDIRDFDNLDYIKHDITQYPWPLPDESVVRAVARHVVEHVPPHNFGFVNFMNEVWRVLKFDGQFAIVTPYATSAGFFQDPTHCNPCNQKTWLYFDPIKGGGLYKIYKPKPWEIVHLTFDPVNNLEVILQKRREDWSYYE